MNNNVRHGIYRNDVWIADLTKINPKYKKRPVLIVSSWRYNTKSSDVNILIISSQEKIYKRTHVYIDGIGTVKCEAILTIEKDLLLNKIGEVDKDIMDQIDNKLKNQLQLEGYGIDVNYVRKIYKSIKNIESFINVNSISNDDELKMTLHILKTELTTYCKKFRYEGEKLEELLKEVSEISE